MAIPYRIGVVSKLTGIHTDTLRAWERRYAAVTPKRGDGPNRTYDRADIARLILLRRAVDRGHAIGTIASFSDQRLRTLLGEQPGSGASPLALITPVLEALYEFNYASMSEQLRRFAVMMDSGELVRQLVLPLMREVGERWHRGEISIAQEHMITSLTEQLLGTLLGMHRPNREATRLIFSTPAGHWHSVGILAAALLAAGCGLSPIYLGPNLPAKEIARAARRSGSRAVVVQLSDVSTSTEEQVRDLRRSLPHKVELWIGGDVDWRLEGALRVANFEALEEQYARLAA